jgi:anti-anti-sigma factor
MSLLDVETRSPLQIQYRGTGPDGVIELSGKLDSSLPPEVRETVRANITPGCHLRLDVSNLTAVSGAGVRMLLLLFRQVRAVGGTISAAGVSQEFLDLADAAGFLELFRANAPQVACPMPPAPVVQRVDAYPTHQYQGYALRAGAPLPFGATAVSRGINFSVYSAHATGCTLVLFEAGQPEPFVEIPFPAEFRSGDVFAMTVFDLDVDATEYGFRMDGPWAPEKGASLRSDQGALGSDGRLDPRPRRVGACARSEELLRLSRSACVPGFRLGRRSSARPADRGPGDLRDARPRLHGQPLVRREAPRHVCRAAGTDFVLEGVGRQLRRAAADLRIRRAGKPAPESAHRRAAVELLGLHTVVSRPVTRRRADSTCTSTSSRRSSKSCIATASR